MNDESKLYDAIQRSNNVSELLENGELNRALDELKAQLIDLWLKSDARNVVGREKMYLEINLIDKLKSHLGIILNNGKMSHAILDTRNKRAAA